MIERQIKQDITIKMPTKQANFIIDWLSDHGIKMEIQIRVIKKFVLMFWNVLKFGMASER